MKDFSGQNIILQISFFYVFFKKCLVLKIVSLVYKKEIIKPC